MADENSALLERAQLLQKAKQIQASKLAAAPQMNGQPGVKAIGVTDGPTPAAEEAEPHTLTGDAVNTLRAGAKGLDVGRGALTGPAIAAALEAITGKDVYRAEEHLNAVNPTNLKAFPGTGEMLDRAGVPEGAKVSDYFPNAYVDPEKGPTNWWNVEKGGMLDPSVRGTVGFIGDVLSDPATYLSLGASAAAKKTAQESASKLALAAATPKGLGSRIIETLGRPVTATGEALSPAVEALKNTRAGRAVVTTATAPSKMAAGLGKKLYNSVLLPIEHEGSKFGKSEIGETLYDAGVMSPFDLRGKAQAATDVLMNARNDILQRATKAGGELDMQEALKFAREKINELKAIDNPNEKGLIQALEADYARFAERGAKEAAPVVQDMVPAYKTDAELFESNAKGMTDVPGEGTMLHEQLTRPGGQPMQGPLPPGQTAIGDVPKPATHRTAVIPSREELAVAEPRTSLEGWKQGSPEEIVELPVQMQMGERTPGPTPIQGSSWKTSAADKANYGDFTHNSKVQQYEAAKARGLREETENAVGKALSPGEGAALADLNSEAGKLIATKRSQKRVGDNMERVANNVTGHATGSHSIMAGIGGLKAVAIKMAIDAGRLGTMPAGAMLRKAGESPLTAPMIDMYLRQKAREQLLYPAPPEEE